MVIRAELDEDRGAVRAVLIAAFPTAAEADLVDRLRERARPLVSLVAGHAGGIVGHVLFSPVALPAATDLALMGLAPLAVLPTHQRTGVGTALVTAGLEACRQIGCSGVCVLGYPEYYGRFGFGPASRFGIDSEYAVPDDVFMLLELRPGALAGRSGRLRYHAAFDGS